MNFSKWIFRISAIAGFTGLVSISTAQVNTLTAAESAAGYDLMFNGTDFTGWHGYKMGTAIPDAWFTPSTAPLGPRIENRDGNKQYIMSNKLYKNFDFKVDVQTPAGGNSGIFIRYEEVASSPFDKRSGPETQVCGPNHPDCGSDKTSFGVCYDMFPVLASLRDTWYNAPGTWNQLRIVAFDSNVVHYGNGKKLLEYKIGTPAFVAAYAASKYASDGNNGRYYDIHPGSIMLQHHGETGITFRNIKAKTLTVHPFKQEFTNGNWPATLSQDFVFGSTTGIAFSGDRTFNLEITTSSSESGSMLVKVVSPHSAFEAVALDGSAIPFRKTAAGSYLLEQQNRHAGVIIVRVRTQGKFLAKKICLP